MTAFTEELEVQIRLRAEQMKKESAQVASSIVKMGATVDRLETSLNRAFSRGAVAAKNFGKALAAVNQGVMLFKSYIAGPLSGVLKTAGEFERM